jgi:LCP family protein required for cell wall assembly
MEPKTKDAAVVAKPHSRWRIVGYVFLFLALVVAVTYARNRQARNIVSGVISSPADTLKNDAGRTNVLLMGMGGQGHQGGDLTDSILFVSFNLSANKATMLALPRDIWIPSMKAKINTAYHYGKDRYEGGGLDLAKDSVSELLGVPVHYVVTLDFQGFVKAIDAVGGIDVEVDRTFDDYKYPIPGKETAEPESARYEHLHFDQGMTHMDGITALRFARSRYAEGEEGTDFARGKRQEKIIMAFRNKVFSTGTIFNSDRLTGLKDSVVSSIDTDISDIEQGAFLKVFLGLGGTDNVKTISIENLLTNPKNTREYGGQWVLVPAPSLEELQSYVKTNLAE